MSSLIIGLVGGRAEKYVNRAEREVAVERKRLKLLLQQTHQQPACFK
jgi:hypothetical protein